MTTIQELLGKQPMSEAEKVALNIASQARLRIPQEVWLAWPSHSLDKWTDEVASIVLNTLRLHNFREAGK